MAGKLHVIRKQVKRLSPGRSVDTQCIQLVDERTAGIRSWDTVNSLHFHLLACEANAEYGEAQTKTETLNGGGRLLSTHAAKKRVWEVGGEVRIQVCGLWEFSHEYYHRIVLYSA